ncbi:hypothetical protein EVAR_74359_1 [Eumeta japonica]|uniref:Uncharacterized protein n=1 Tax=Eumeta variegata TaxID=151549 RepID=A0A4C1SFZ4_EUMVA|nr:hypothetical protein EVAR_74359_1 [Eumeta japonica]
MVVNSFNVEGSSCPQSEVMRFPAPARAASTRTWLFFPRSVTSTTKKSLQSETLEAAAGRGRREKVNHCPAGGRRAHT